MKEGVRDGISRGVGTVRTGAWAVREGAGRMLHPPPSGAHVYDDDGYADEYGDDSGMGRVQRLASRSSGSGGSGEVGGAGGGGGAGRGAGNPERHASTGGEGGEEGSEEDQLVVALRTAEVRK